MSVQRRRGNAWVGPKGANGTLLTMKFVVFFSSSGRMLMRLDDNVVKCVIGHEMSQVPEFEEAAFGAPLNKVVRCKTKFGWHLLQVLSERYI